MEIRTFVTLPSSVSTRAQIHTARMDVILYTRTGCHLCDDALDVLRQHELQPTLVDIDSDEGFREQFDTCVPVVEIDGKIRFRGKVDPVLLRRLLTKGERGA